MHSASPSKGLTFLHFLFISTLLLSLSSISPSFAIRHICNSSLWIHVYNPSRLQVVNSCISVTGVIANIKPEADGDFHMRVKLDPQFANLVNDANIQQQHGDLVVEPVCQNPITQTDAISACFKFHQNIDIPQNGTHVKVTGSYVLDTEHNNWAEIHPVTHIDKIS